MVKSLSKRDVLSLLSEPGALEVLEETYPGRASWTVSVDIFCSTLLSLFNDAKIKTGFSTQAFVDAFGGKEKAEACLMGKYVPDSMEAKKILETLNGSIKDPEFFVIIAGRAREQFESTIPLESPNLKYGLLLKLLINRNGISGEEEVAALAEEMNLYGSGVRALIEGSAIPSEEVARKIHSRLGDNLGLDVSYSLRARELSIAVETDPRRSWAMQAMGRVTLDTKIGGDPDTVLKPLFQDLFDRSDSPFSLRDAEAETGIGENRLSQIKRGAAEEARLEGIKTRVRFRERIYQPYKEETISALAGYFGFDGTECEQLLSDLAFGRKRVRKLSDMIQESVDEGRSFGEFLLYVRTQTNYPQHKLAQIMCTTQPNISVWSREVAGAESVFVERWIRTVVYTNNLDENAEANLWRLRRGTRKHGSADDIIERGKKVLEDGYKGKIKPDNLPNLILKQLFEESGLTLKILGARIGLGPPTLASFLEREDLDLDPPLAKRIAEAFVPDDETKRIDLTNVLLRRRKTLTISDVLNEVLTDIGVAVKADRSARKEAKERGTVPDEPDKEVKARISRLIKWHLRESGETLEKFGEAIGTGFSHANKLHRGENLIAKPKTAAAIAKHIGVYETDRHRCTKLLLGRPIFYDASVLQDFYSGRKTQEERKSTLATLRENAGYSQEELAKALRTTQKIITHSEARGFIPEDLIERMAVKFLIPSQDRDLFREEFAYTKERRHEFFGKPGRKAAGISGAEKSLERGPHVS